MLLEGNDICFGYHKDHLILNHISLGIKAGERVALTGPSGCGKSTLSRILAGYETPASGQVLFEGRPLPREGYCPVQLIYQHPEQALNPRWKLHKSLREAWDPNPALLEEIGIEKQWLTRYPGELSGGELQRFCVVRALGPQTKVLIADEMSAMLDVITQAQIWRLVLRVVEERGLGLLVVTHSPELAGHLCTRMVPFQELAECQEP